MQNYTEINNSDSIEDIKNAYLFCCNEYSHQELIQELHSDNDLKKQLCIIKLNKLENQSDADSLVYNLTEHAGLIREVCSVKINELIKDSRFRLYFQTINIINSFIKACLDINPTVCRNIIEILCYIENKTYLKNKLVEKFLNVNEELKNFKGYKSHTENKKVFKLYWCLEALSMILTEFEADTNFQNIITIATNYDEYTIREKASKILSIVKKNEPYIKELKNILSQDENFFVRRYLI